ncbi:MULTISPECIES: ABC transporter permease [Rhodobacterales]|uniref:ABC transporter permease n=1 Tax=Rhodobacterales TaxID=204455 RepID=UPI00237F228B|nr:ABC transporter permease [Phaeobacter gallaeciensis]MDE4139626.1 ABC transporter permease [Phaeobacter gallaeciensis]MDE4147316.1 ABC transporter permease [Phaeobacter gallaeciensis]MDE4151535.1 ABC transporter permease [Phaeobacter gallaeciensis]MDE4227681.1 ABC transporter permease [Phaeobacter gallaeciensis]MDE4255999.1 ABC transporter permease [Phaeobacter gallaeciensis]
MISYRHILAIIRKELLQLRRDRLTFGMIVMIPLIQLVLFGYAINTEVRHIPAAIVDQSNTDVSRALVQMVEATQVVRFESRFATVAEAEGAIMRADVRAAFIIPKDVSQRLVRNPAVGARFSQGATDTTARPVAQWIADGSDTLVAGAIRSLRTMPLEALLRQPSTRPTPTFEVALFYNPEQRTVVNIVPGLVGIILTMTMIMFTAAAIVRESERGNMEMLIATPIRPLELMIGKIVPFVGIGLIQVTIILGLGWALFSVTTTASVWTLLVVTLLFIIASLSLGLVISTIAKNQLQAMQMTIFVLLPSILLSGFMFPYEGMPEGAQRLADLLPVTHFLRIIRGVFLRDAGLADVLPDAAWLIGFAVLGMTIASLRFRKRLD